MPKSPDEAIIVNALLAYSKKQIFDVSIDIQADDLLSDTGIDSHNLLDLVIFLEREFNISISDSDLTAENLASISSIAKCAARAAK